MKLLKSLFLVFSLLIAGSTFAATPETTNGVTRIHLDQHNGYFAAHETLASLKPGDYEFVITNKADKLVGFQIQNYKTHETLDMFPLEPGQQKISKVTISEDGFRYRCPINPTPWYDVENVQK